MLQFEELRLKLQGMEPELRELKQSLNIDKLGIEIAELERKAAEPSFWDDMENSQKVLQRTAQLKASVETYQKLQALYDRIAGRKAFEYDPEEDEDYQRYAKLYAAQWSDLTEV